MKKIRPESIRLLAAILLLTSTASAQVSPTINYQGRVAVDAINFDGTGDFKFAFVDPTGATTYWSNDGTSAAGSEPTDAVPIPVSQGLFSVLLGDTTLTNMTQAIPANVFTDNTAVYLRIWFSDRVSAFELLAPDVQLGYVPYTVRALEADDAGALDGIDSAEFPRFDGDGNLGIGVDDPLGALHLSGDAGFVGPGSHRVLAEVVQGVGGFSQLNGPRWVHVSGSTAYVVSRISAALTIIDVTDPANPQLLAEVVDEVGGFNRLDAPYSVFVSGDTAYVTSDLDDALTIIDVTDPANPLLLAEVVDGVGGFDRLDSSRGVFVSGDTAFVASLVDDALTIIDVTDPANPQLLEEVVDGVGGFNRLNGAYGLFVSGDTVYLTASDDNALTIIDLFAEVDLIAENRVGIGTTTPDTELQVAGTVHTSSLEVDGNFSIGIDTPQGAVHLNGNTGFLEPGSHSPALLAEVVDGQGGFNRLRGAESVYVSGNTAYVAAESALTIIDVTDLGNPQLLAEVVDGVGGFNRLLSARSVHVSGHTAYVTSTADDALTIIDVTDPANPQLLAEVVDGVGGFDRLDSSTGVFVSGDTAFVASSFDHALTIIDVSDPANPKLLEEAVDGVGGLNRLSGAQGLFVSGDIVYLAAIIDNALSIIHLFTKVDLIAENRVGIGTATPDSELQVEGTIHTSSLEVDGATELNGTLDLGGNDLLGVGSSLAATGALEISATGGSNTLTIASDEDIVLDASNGSIHMLASDTTINLNANSTVGGTLVVTEEDGADGALTDALTVSHLVSDGPGADGIGSGILFKAENDAGMTEEVGRIGFVLTDASDGSETSVLRIATRDSGGDLRESVSFDGAGNLGIGVADPQGALHLSGDTGFVGPGTHRVLAEIVDVAGPLSQVLGGFNRLNGARWVHVSGSTAYVVSRFDHALTIIDVTDPANPQLLAEVVDGTGGFNRLAGAISVFVSGNTAFVAATADNALTIIDVTDPANPQLLAEVVDRVDGFNRLSGANWVHVSGGTAYVTAASDDSLTIIDVTDPANPQLLEEVVDGAGGYSRLNGAKSVFVSGITAFVVAGSDNALTIIDLVREVDLIAENRVGIGTATPDSELQVDGTIHASSLEVDGDLDVDAGTLHVDSANGRVGIGIDTGLTHLLHVNGVARSTQAAFDTSSDRRAKTNIHPLSGSLDKLEQLQPVVYEYTEEFKSGNSALDGQRVGFVAQNVEAVMPEMVSRAPESVGDTRVEDFRYLNASNLVPMLVEAVKDLKAQLEKLENANAEMRREHQEKISRLENEIAELRNQSAEAE